jgi:hypothetical protein
VEAGERTGCASRRPRRSALLGGQGPLHLLQDGEEQLVLQLAAAGADVNAADCNGDTPLCCACVHGERCVGRGAVLLVPWASPPDSPPQPTPPPTPSLLPLPHPARPPRRPLAGGAHADDAGGGGGGAQPAGAQRAAHGGPRRALAGPGPQLAVPGGRGRNQPRLLSCSQCPWGRAPGCRAQGPGLRAPPQASGQPGSRNRPQASQAAATGAAQPGQQQGVHGAAPPTPRDWRARRRARRRTPPLPQVCLFDSCGPERVSMARSLLKAGADPATKDIHGSTALDYARSSGGSGRGGGVRVAGKKGGGEGARGQSEVAQGGPGGALGKAARCAGRGWLQHALGGASRPRPLVRGGRGG